MSMPIQSFAPPCFFLKITGKDATDFLHRITTCHIKALTPGVPQGGLVLQPTGKIQAYFHILKTETPEEYLLFTPQNMDEVLKTFDQFHFGEKVFFEKLSYFYVRQVSSEGSPSNSFIEKPLHHWKPEEIKTDLKNQNLTDQAFIFSEKPGLSFSPLQQWNLLRIANKLPQWDQEITPNVLPLEVGLDSFVHENKGCYPGQEVIEKIRSYGKPPRRLLVIEGGGPLPSIGTPLDLPDQPAAGQLTSVENLGEKWIALGLLKRVYLTKENENNYRVNQRLVKVMGT